jgi:hypothetical protein
VRHDINDRKQRRAEITKLMDAQRDAAARRRAEADQKPTTVDTFA